LSHVIVLTLRLLGADAASRMFVGVAGRQATDGVQGATIRRHPIGTVR
jgi:hypothetical protein